MIYEIVSLLANEQILYVLEQLNYHTAFHSMEDIFTSVAPVYYYGKLFGNANYKPIGIVGYRVFQFDKCTWICTTILGVLNVFYSVYITCTYYTEKRYTDPALNLINFIQLNTHAILVMAILTLNTFYNKQHICLNQISNFDKQLNIMGIFLDYKTVFHRMTKRIALDMLTVLILVGFSYMDYEPWTWVGLLSYIIVQRTVMSMMIHFEFWMHLIRDRFLALHNHLLNIAEDSETNLINDTSHKYQMRNGLVKISKLHQELSCFTRNINSKYSIQIFLIINLTFLMLLMDYCNFWIYVLVGDDDYDVSAWLYLVYWIACDWINLAILLMTCSNTNDSANDIKKVLNHIKLCTTDPILKQETMLFSLQLLNNDLSINASGFFNVDYGLMFKMISVVTTYMVILLQYRLGASGSAGDMIANTTSNSTIFK